MTLLHAINPLYTISGLVVGVLVGMTGVGGGSLMTPLLVLLFGITPGTAVGTDLLYAALTKTVGTAVHSAGGTVDWRIVRRLASGSIPATLLTLWMLSQLGVDKGGASLLITHALGLALILTAISLIFRRQLLAWAQNRSGASEPEALHPQREAVFTVMTGVVLGVLVSLSSVGAGAIGVTALILLYPRLSTARIVGSDIAHAVPLTFIAGMGHWYLGSVDLSLLASLLTGSIPGIIVGSLISTRVPEGVLRPILAGTLVLVGFKLIG